MYFNYFLPDRDKTTLDELESLGLGYVFTPEPNAAPRSVFTPRPATNGPSKEPGLVVSLSSEWCGYHVGKQVWKKEVDAPYWVGMWTDQRPTPETLKRDNMIEGRTLRLDDGNIWTLPVARHWEEFDGDIFFRRTLPSRLTRNDAGEWYPGEVKERYRELWELATGLMDAIVEGRSEFFGIDDLVIECFRCNYKVSATEIDLLGIHDDQLRMNVPRILLDLENWKTLCKKKLTALDTGSSSDGPFESQPVMDTASTTPQ